MKALKFSKLFIIVLIAAACGSDAGNSVNGGTPGSGSDPITGTPMNCSSAQSAVDKVYNNCFYQPTQTFTSRVGYSYPFIRLGRTVDFVPYRSSYASFSFCFGSSSYCNMNQGQSSYDRNIFRFDGNVTNFVYGNSSDAVKNGLLSEMNGATSIKQVPYINGVLTNSVYEIVKGDYVTYIDFKYPLAAQPMMRFNFKTGDGFRIYPGNNTIPLTYEF